MIKAFRNYRPLRVVLMLCILGGFAGGCFVEKVKEKDTDHEVVHHDHD